MESIIKHLIDITGHRDRDLMGMAMIATMRELTESEGARIVDIVFIDGHQTLQAQISFVNGEVVVTDSFGDNDDKGEKLADYPELLEGLSKQVNMIESVKSNGDNIVWMPVWINDKTNMLLEIVNPKKNSETIKELMMGIMIVYRNFQNLLDYSERDSLTGLLNRKTFDDSFSKMLKAIVLVGPDRNELDVERRLTQEEEKHNWLAVLDIDFFKRVNDQFGHLYGDEVLILVANLMRSSFRPSDRLFRFGGEEFVILLKSTSKTDAEKVFNRFRETIAQHVFPQVGHVTISIGFSHINPNEPAVGIMGRADQALYYAKSNGRNQVCHFESLVENGLLVIETPQKSEDSIEFF